MYKFRHYCCLLSIFLFIPTISQAEIVDRVVAIVNEDVITLSELEEEGSSHFAKVKANVSPELMAQALEKAKDDILNSLIDRTLLKQRADRYGLKISPEEIEAQVAGIRKKNGLSAEQFNQELTKMGTSLSKYKENLYHEIVRQKLLNHEIYSKVIISDEQIAQYYETEYGQDNTQEGLHILQIGCQWGMNSSNSSEREAKMRIEQLKGMIEAGESFQELASEYSDLPSAKQGGDIGNFKEDELSELMQNALKGLKPGELSRIIKNNNSYQFFKLLMTRDGDKLSIAPLKEVKDDIRNILKQKEVKIKFEEWVLELKELAYIKKQL